MRRFARLQKSDFCENLVTIARRPCNHRPASRVILTSLVKVESLMPSIVHSVQGQRRVSYGRLTFIAANLALWAVMICAVIAVF